MFQTLPPGIEYCGPAQNNSTGLPAELGAVGSPGAADNCLVLRAMQLPTSSLGYFVNSQTQGFFQPPGSQGILCLSGAIGRYRSQVLDSGTTGTFHLALDLANTPTPGGPVAIQPGETWSFQAWFRDGPDSNFTDGVAVTFE